MLKYLRMDKKYIRIAVFLMILGSIMDYFNFPLSLIFKIIGGVIVILYFLLNYVNE